MAYFADLCECAYFHGLHSDILRAVGWLEPDHSYCRGDVPRPFFRRLCELLQEPWTPVTALGSHLCEFCRFTGGGQATLHLFEDVTDGQMGLVPSLRVPGHSFYNLYVPDTRVVYVSPELIAHYIDAHGYRPPDEFIDAVMVCPEMNSQRYFDALRATGWDIDCAFTEWEKAFAGT